MMTNGGSRCCDILDTIRARRSVRHYAGRPVDRCVLDRLLEAARWAPSNWNGQPSVFVVLDDRESIARVHGTLIARTMAVTKAAVTDHRLARFVEHCRAYFDVLRDCPVLIAACYKPTGQTFDHAVVRHFRDPGGVAAWSPNLLSLGMAVQNLLLCAHATGLGACFHSGPVPFLRGPLHELLRLPPRLELAGFVTLGWPAPEAPSRAVGRKPLAHSIRWAKEREA
jgi:coenzyme F420-0:L-glutamate ligase/coenzyme F420-1:gamma-L-glutamate ligase